MGITLEIKKIINRRKYDRNFVLNKSITYSISFKIDIINNSNILWFFFSIVRIFFFHKKIKKKSIQCAHIFFREIR